MQPLLTPDGIFRKEKRRRQQAAAEAAIAGTETAPAPASRPPSDQQPEEESPPPPTKRRRTVQRPWMEQCGKTKAHLTGSYASATQCSALPGGTSAQVDDRVKGPQPQTRLLVIVEPREKFHLKRRVDIGIPRRIQ